jgi:hypothetical protein
MVSLHAIAQQFSPPQIPKYDSVFIEYFKNNIHQKEYFLKGKQVFEIGYKSDGLFWDQHSTIASEFDSCYTYYKGKDHDEYDVYYFNSDYIKNERFAETSKILNYSIFTWYKKLRKTGTCYFIKELNNRTISHSQKYSIGKWIKYKPDGQPVTIIDFDNFTEDGKPIVYKGKKAIITQLKELAEKRIIEVYGKEFFKKYIHFNSARSAYHTEGNAGPSQPDGASIFFIPDDEEIQSADLSYDIILGEERFNVINFRILKNGKFLGKTTFEKPDKAVYLCNGLDVANTKQFHSNVINWKEIATRKGFDVGSKNFNIKFTFKPTSDYSGELRLVLEQVVKTVETKNSFTNTLKQYIINPWTGNITQSTTEGTYSVAE